MMLTLASLLTLMFIGPSTATPLLTGMEVCTTAASGQLTTADGQPVSFEGGRLVFGGSLQVEFRPCQPNYGRFEDGTMGHLFVPSLEQCISVNSPASGAPYKVGTQECQFADDSHQIFMSFVQRDGGLYWSGSTKADGSIVQNSRACSNGFWGPQSGATAGDVRLQCSLDGNTVGFQIA
ncbi:hypothetical protein BOTBODRAFT_170215 [Botryobasidium botryosum FD-172 SS1]|uniref:AA1-like domain-containing protein n=1 Tax=Botryobasidium botryosum (strain FD-172 SS1) TaxID=930990 RepID=A0A067MX69_BOTB1|nr:hypothetical protein BOTBODRAFT_170215 [Botryobasidium botryosum FD-172 SS1]